MSQVCGNIRHRAQTGKPLVSRQRISAYSWCEGRTAPLIASRYIRCVQLYSLLHGHISSHTWTGAREERRPTALQSRYCPQVVLALRRLISLRTACGFGDEASSASDIELASCIISTLTPSNVDFFLSISWHQGPNQQPSK